MVVRVITHKYAFGFDGFMNYERKNQIQAIALKIKDSLKRSSIYFEQTYSIFLQMFTSSISIHFQGG